MHPLPFQPATMPVYSTGFGNQQMFMPQQSHLTTPPSGPPHAELRVPRINFTPTTTKTDRLILHRQFGYYSHLIRSLLHLNEHEWYIYTQVRSNPSFHEILPSFHIAPPPDIFNAISDIRGDKSWETEKAGILKQVDEARRRSVPSSTSSNGSSHALSQTHLTPASASTRSGSRDRQFQQTGGSHQPRPSHHSPSRAYRSSHEEASPTTTSSYNSTGNAGRTAPDGSLYYCPSKNCKKGYGGKGYLRQGHYENHMRECHAEWPLHDPSISLRQKPLDDDAFMTNSSSHDGTRVSEESVSPTTPQPIVDASTPYTSLIPSREVEGERPTTPSPDRVSSDTIETGTGPEICRSVQGVLPVDYFFPDRQQANFPMLVNQTGSNFLPMYYRNDSYMGS